MKVMRMASGRGQSHFNISDFLEPFINETKVRYPMNINDQNSYYPNSTDDVRDKMSFLPACTYSNKDPFIGTHCKLFQPVVTDLGICYSFNAKSSLDMLKNSSFTEAFYEAYRYDFIESSEKKAEGAGDKFSLRFMIDNSKYLRRKLETHPFKVIISGKRGYFDALSIGKEVTPGYETIFDIQPLEVVGTNDLRGISEEARDCRFSDEVNNDSIFKVYSQPSCEFECKMNEAREKCRCTPWNFPNAPSISEPTICDLYGNSCFHSKMSEARVVKKCIKKCPSDCEDVRFSVNKQVIPINLASYCKEYLQDGAELTKKLLQSGVNIPDFHPLVDEFYSMDKNDELNITEYGEPFWKIPCYEIMTKEIAVVKVRMEYSKYMKTIMDRRLSFADKLAAFGKEKLCCR